MVEHVSKNRTLWLVTGIVVGLCVSQFWPHEPVQAGTSDRDTNKIIMATSQVDGDIEGVFMLDQLQGRLSGAVFNTRTGGFTHTYLRNLANDFAVQEGASPRYLMVAGRALITARGRLIPGQSVIYVAELNSGVMLAYSFHYTISQKPVPTSPFLIVGKYQFGAGN